MPVIPEFQPASAPGSILQNSQSLMQRAQANRRAEEAAQMERDKFEIMRPVLESQARVQLVSEANDLTAAHIVNNSIANDLQRFPDYVKQWTESALIEEPKQRLNERRRILGAITPFAAIKSTAPMVKAFQEQFAQDATADKTADYITGRAEVAAAGNETKLAKADKDLEMKRVALDAQQKQFELRQQHAQELEKLRAENRQALEETKAANAKDLEGVKGQNRVTAADSGVKTKAALKVNEAAMAEAQQATVDLRDYTIALKLLNDPDVRTGTGAAFENTARRVGGIFGMDMSGVKNIEQLQTLLGATMLEKARGMKGSLSDKDVALLQQITPSVGKTNEGNIALLNLLVQKKNRDLEIGNFINEARRAGATEREIQMDVFDYLQEHPLGTPAAPGLTPQEQTRLQELRSKLGK